MKKLLALLFVLTTLISLLTACAETGDPDNAQTSKAEETTEIARLDNVPADLKYNVRIL